MRKRRFKKKIKLDEFMRVIRIFLDSPGNITNISPSEYIKTKLKKVSHNSNSRIAGNEVKKIKEKLPLT